MKAEPKEELKYLYPLHIVLKIIDVSRVLHHGDNKDN